MFIKPQILSTAYKHLICLTISVVTIMPSYSNMPDNTIDRTAFPSSSPSITVHNERIENSPIMPSDDIVSSSPPSMLEEGTFIDFNDYLKLSGNLLEFRPHDSQSSHNRSTKQESGGIYAKAFVPITQNQRWRAFVQGGVAYNNVNEGTYSEEGDLEKYDSVSAGIGAGTSLQLNENASFNALYLSTGRGSESEITGAFAEIEINF